MVHCLLEFILAKADAQINAYGLELHVINASRSIIIVISKCSNCEIFRICSASLALLENPRTIAFFRAFCKPSSHSTKLPHCNNRDTAGVPSSILYCHACITFLGLSTDLAAKGYLQRPADLQTKITRLVSLALQFRVIDFLQLVF